MDRGDKVSESTALDEKPFFRKKTNLEQRGESMLVYRCIPLPCIYFYSFIYLFQGKPLEIHYLIFKRVLTKHKYNHQ